MKRPFAGIRTIAIVATVAALLTGCGNRAARMDRREESHPLLRRAQKAKNDNDIDRAVALYREALEKRPDLARAHLELGLLYDDPWNDRYLRAIYHYERYLEMRPDTEKRAIVEGLILGARLAFAASLPQPPPGAVEEIAALRKELRILKDRLADCEQRVDGGFRPPAPAAERADDGGPTAPPAPAPAAAAMRTYAVQAGDTLSRIAVKMYNDSTKWRLILDANRDQMSRPEDLRVGQTLVIPVDESPGG
jgi:tetratricopeptide (TPR) repeat protein